MATTVTSIVTSVALLLNDIGHDRWSETELVNYLSEAEVEIVTIDSSANIAKIAHTLQAGVSQQAPDDCNELLSVSMNLGRDWVADVTYYQGQMVYDSDTRYQCNEGHTAGSTFASDSSYWDEVTYFSGLQIEEITEANIDHLLSPDWSVASYPEDTSYEPTVAAWLLQDGPGYHNEFQVSPPQPATGQMNVLLRYSQTPAPVTISDNITIADKYKATIIDYMLFRAYSRDIDTPDNKNTIQIIWQKFSNSNVFTTRRT